MNAPEADNRFSKLPFGMAEQNIQSWRRVAAFFEELQRHAGWEFLGPMRALISKLSESELAPLFRAGQSLDFLVISTADKHGLEIGQPYVAVLLEPTGPWQIRSGLTCEKPLQQHTIERDEDIFPALLPFLDWLC